MEIESKLIKSLEMSGLKPQTIESHIIKIKVFLRNIEETNPNNITLDTILEFLRELKYEKKYAIGTVNSYRSSLKYLYEIILEKQWLDKKVPRLHGYKPLPFVLSQEDIIRFIQAVSNKMYQYVLYTMYSSGLRVGEVVALKVKDIDSTRMLIYIAEGKNGSARNAILSKKNLKLLREYILEWKRKYGYKFAPEDYLFPSSYSKGEHISSKTIKNNIIKTAKRINFNKPITSHVFRHSYATHLYEAGVDIFAIKKLMGHKNIRTTSMYTQLASLSNMGFSSPFDMEGDK